MDIYQIIKTTTENVLQCSVIDTDELADIIEQKLKIAFGIEKIDYVFEFCGDKAVVIALNVCYFFDVKLIKYKDGDDINADI